MDGSFLVKVELESLADCNSLPHSWRCRSCAGARIPSEERTRSSCSESCGPPSLSIPFHSFHTVDMNGTAILVPTDCWKFNGRHRLRRNKESSWKTTKKEASLWSGIKEPFDESHKGRATAAIRPANTLHNLLPWSYPTGLNPPLGQFNTRLTLSHWKPLQW